MKRLTAITLVLVLCLSLAACGGKQDYDEALQGRWEFTPDDASVPVCTRYEFDNGKVVRTHFRDGAVFGNIDTGEYRINGDQVEITFDHPGALSITMNCVMDGDTLVLVKDNGSATGTDQYHKVQ